MSKYIEFVEEGRSDSGKTRQISVMSKSSAVRLGWILWYGEWRQYTFQPEEATVFSHDCLLTISRYCYSLNQEHRDALKAAKEKVK